MTELALDGMTPEQLHSIVMGAAIIRLRAEAAKHGRGEPSEDAMGSIQLGMNLGAQAMFNELADRGLIVPRMGQKPLVLLGTEVTPLDCGTCIRDDSDPERVLILRFSHCSDHGRY